MAKPGRNDPCWCGSGKKYKNCHMREDERAESRNLITRNLIERLDEYALGREFEQDLRSAFEFYTRRKFELPEDEDRLIEFQGVLDFFTYDYRLPDGRGVIERFAAEHGKRLSADERALVADWQHSRLTAFEVVGVERGVGMRLRDLVTGEEFDVLEKTGTQDLNRWEIVVSRLLRVRDHYEMGRYAGLRFPAGYRDWLRGYLDEQQGRYQINHPESTYEEFLHASSQLLHQFIIDEVMPALTAPPTMVTAEGDISELCQATFAVLDHAMALAGLNAAEEFAGEEEEETEDAELSFAWREAGASLGLLRAHGPDFEHKDAMGVEQGGIRNLGHISLTRDTLTLEVTSRRRLEAGKELLAMRLGQAIRHRADDIKSIAEMLAQMPELAEEEPPEEEMPEEIETMRAEMAATYHRQWLDQEIPALDGQTPREAVKTFGGRVRVIRLLKEFEASEDRQARAGELSFDLDELKMELGIADQDLAEESRLEDQMERALNEISEMTFEDRIDDALAAWRAFRAQYPIANLQDLEFAEIWDLADILPETLETLVHHLAMFKRYDEGIALLEEYLALDPDDPEAVRADIAELRAERGEIDQALRELEELVQAAPDNHAAISTLASIQRDLLNRADDAIATLRRGLENVEEDWQEDLYDEIIATYLAFQRADEAENFWHAENDAAEEKDYLSLIRILLARSNLPASASQDLERARESASKIESQPAREHWLGMVEARAGNFDAARQLWADDLKEPEFDDWVFWLTWVDLHLRLRDFDRVIEKFDPVKLGAHATGYFNLALAHAARGELNRAAELAQAGRAEMERHTRRIHWQTIRHEVRELADELQLSPAARQAMQL